MNTRRIELPSHTTVPEGWRAGRNGQALGLRIELGRRKLGLPDLAALAPGSVVELDTGATDDVDIYANGQLLARGEAVSVGGKLAVRVREVMATEIDGIVSSAVAMRRRTDPT